MYCLWLWILYIEAKHTSETFGVDKLILWGLFSTSGFFLGFFFLFLVIFTMLVFSILFDLMMFSASAPVQLESVWWLTKLVWDVTELKEGSWLSLGNKIQISVIFCWHFSSSYAFYYFLWLSTIFLIFLISHKHEQTSWFQTMEFIESTHAKSIKEIVVLKLGIWDSNSFAFCHYHLEPNHSRCWYWGNQWAHCLSCSGWCLMILKSL